MKKLLTTLLCIASLSSLGQRPKRVDSTVQVIIIPKITIDTFPKVSKLDSFINTWKGKPYKYGGTTLNGIDCSGFTQKLYQEIFNLDIPRTAYNQYKSAIKIAKTDLSIGDLLFFMSPQSPSGWHVGVYLGNNQYIHAANKRIGVVLSELNESILKRVYSIGRFENK